MHTLVRSLTLAQIEASIPLATTVHPSTRGSGNGLWNFSGQLIPAFAGVAIVSYGPVSGLRAQGGMSFQHDARGSRLPVHQGWQTAVVGSTGRWFGGSANHDPDSGFSIVSVLTQDGWPLGILAGPQPVPSGTEIVLDYGLDFGSMETHFPPVSVNTAGPQGESYLGQGGSDLPVTDGPNSAADSAETDHQAVDNAGSCGRGAGWSVSRQQAVLQLGAAPVALLRILSY